MLARRVGYPTASPRGQSASGCVNVFIHARLCWSTGVFAMSTPTRKFIVPRVLADASDLNDEIAPTCLMKVCHWACVNEGSMTIEQVLTPGSIRQYTSLPPLCASDTDAER